MDHGPSRTTAGGNIGGTERGELQVVGHVTGTCTNGRCMAMDVFAALRRVY